MKTPNKLDRALGLRYVVVMVISNIIGSGVYKKVAPMAAELHSSGWVLIAWVLGGVISLMGALCNAEVAGLLADTGGEYVYYKKIYNKFFAFFFGWSLFAVIQTAGISSVAYVFAQSLNSMIGLPQLFPHLATVSIGGIFYPFADFSVKLTTIILILALTWFNTRGVKSGAGLSNALVALVFIGIFIIIAFGISSPAASVGQAFDMSTTNHQAVTISSVFTAMLAAFWAYQGWASVGFIGGEIKDARRTLPRGIVLGVVVMIGLYLLVNAAYLALIPVPQMEAIHGAGNKIAAVEAVRTFWGNGGAFFISILILLSTLGCTHATIMASARTYYAMAREGMFFRPVKELNEKRAPVNSLLFQCVWACVLVLSGTFDQLTDMIIFVVFIYYGATTLGVFILRRKMPDAHRPYKVWGYPAVPAIVILFCAGLFVNTFLTRPREAAIGTVLMLTGVPMYFWFQRKSKGVVEEAAEELPQAV